MPRSTRASAMSSRRHLTFALGVAVSLALAATAALSLVYTPRDPLAMAGAARLEGPSRTHPFGTDQYGRDVLSRVMAGAPTSIAVGVIAVGIGALAGIVLGLASGWIGGWLHESAKRPVGAGPGFPGLLFPPLFSPGFCPGIG